jgi:hypothetical protein
MTDKDLKPIPKYIENKIRAYDKIACPTQTSLRFYAYLTVIKKELVKITVAMRNNRKKQQFIKQVAIHGLYSDKAFVRDLEYNFLGVCAYRVGWYEEGISHYRAFFNTGKWYMVDFKYYNPFAPVVNIELALKLFPYSAIDLYHPVCPIRYLRVYIRYPQAEYLIKLGLSQYAERKTILKKIGKDKKFCKWLIVNRPLLQSQYFYADVILHAYATGKTLTETQKNHERKLKFVHERSYTLLRQRFTGANLDRFLAYTESQNISYSAYNDYYRACTYLEMDMTEEKNLFPHDFRRWHDMRIDQYHTAKAMKDAEERQELYAKFAAVAEKYLPLQRNNKAFVVIIAKSPNELIHEGEILHHCVGRMNYDQKFAREESLIFFLRNADEPDTPFVTIEYSLKSKKVLQCYGDKDSKPSESVLEFVHTKWLPYANRKLKQIAI